MASDTITRKDIITDDAIKWGGEYIKEVEKAIGKNQEFINSMKILNDLAKDARLTKNINDFTEAQKKADAQVSLTQNIWKEQLNLENQLISSKKKIQLATESTNRELAKQKIILQEQNKQVKQEAQSQLGLVSVYQKVQNKLNALGKEYSDLSIRKNIGVKLTEEESKRMDFLQKKITLYDDALKLTDANQGKHQRSVGNYAKTYDVLGNSINQLTRELPAFSVSLNTGFLAISNNIPAFFDALSRIKTELNAAKQAAMAGATAQGNLAKEQAILGGATEEAASAIGEQATALALSSAEGVRGRGVLRQLAGSFFSIQTLLSIGITLLTVYGGKLIEMAQEAFATSEELERMAKAQEDVNFAVHQGNVDAQEEVTHLRNLESVILDNTASMHKRLGAVADLRKLMPDHLKGYSDEAILAGEASIQIDKLAQALTNSAIARALESRIAQQAVKDFDARRKLVADINTEIANTTRVDAVTGNVRSEGFGGNVKVNERETAIAKSEARKRGLATLKAFDDAVAEASRARTKEFNKYFTPSADITGGSEDKKETPKKLQGVSDATFELEKQRLERVISVNNDIAKNQEETDEKRIESLGISLNTQEDLINKSRDNELEQTKITYEKEVSEGNKTKEGLKQLEENYIADKKKIYEKASNDIIDVEKKTAEEIKKLREFDTKEYEAELKRGLDQVEISNENAIQAEQERYSALKALGFANDKEKEKAAEDHERILFNIKKAGLIAQTKLQINALSDELNAYEAQSDGSQKSQDFILNKRAEVAKLSRQLTEAEGTTFNENEKKKTKTAKEQLDEILSISSDALGDLADLSNAFSEGKIQKLEEEIDKNNEYFDKQIELAENDETKKKTLEKERELRNAEINKKIVKEKEKQAKFDKAVAIAQIAIQTALSIVKASPNPVLIALAAVAGAIALATAIATPIPKFKKGTQNAPAGLAYVGDGGVSEVITDKNGMNPVLTPATDTLVMNKGGEQIFPNIGAYQDYLRNQQIRQMGSFGSVRSDDRMLSELQKNTKAIERLKLSVNVKSNKTDLSHQFWAKQNRNWN